MKFDMKWAKKMDLTTNRISSGRWKIVGVVTVAVPLVVCILLLLVAVFRTLSFKQESVHVPHALQLISDDIINDSDIENRTSRLVGALMIDTVSEDHGIQDFAGLLKFHEFIKKSFPLIHNCSFIDRTVVNKYSLLYHVRGSNDIKTPYLFSSHMDVVPASLDLWEVAPHNGEIINDTYVYGRGALDDKLGVMGVLEAVEFLLEKGVRPKRSFYLAFGHDGEIGGTNGAAEIALTLKDGGVNSLHFVLDEGFPVSSGIITQTPRQIAIIGVSEKGNLNLELTVTGNPSHSSYPPKSNPIGILATAISRLESKPYSAQLEGPSADTFNYLLPYMSWTNKFFFTNQWLFSRIVNSRLEDVPYTNALLRTTVASTVFQSGTKENVIPPLALAVVNHRIHPSESEADILSHNKKVIDDDRVSMRVTESREALPVSPYAGEEDVPFQLLATTIKQIYPDAVVVPGMCVVNTDTRWFLPFTKNLYRFLPSLALPEDALRYHGNNERVAIRQYHRAVNFYYRVIRNVDLIVGAEDALPKFDEHYNTKK